MRISAKLGNKTITIHTGAAGAELFDKILKENLKKEAEKYVSNLPRVDSKQVIPSYPQFIKENKIYGKGKSRRRSRR